MGPDLATMYNHGMGASASYMGGQMFSADQAQQAEKLKAMQLENAQSSAMNPLNAQFRQGQVAQQAAELPGVQGQSQSLGAKGSEDQQVLTAKVAERLSGMSTQIGANGMQQMGQDGEKLSVVAQAVKTLPPALQKDAFVRGVQQYGGNVNSPMFQSLMQAPDEQFQVAADTLGKGMALAGQKYTQESTTHAATAASNERIHAANNAATVEAAKVAAQSRVQAAESRSKAAMNHMNVDQKIAYLGSIPADERTPAEQASLVEFKTQRLQERAAGAPAVAPTMLDQKTPLQAAADAARGNTPAPNNGPDFASIAKKQGQVYDPDHYIYKVDNSGTLLRKPK